MYNYGGDKDREIRCLADSRDPPPGGSKSSISSVWPPSGTFAKNRVFWPKFPLNFWPKNAIFAFLARFARNLGFDKEGGGPKTAKKGLFWGPKTPVFWTPK